MVHTRRTGSSVLVFRSGKILLLRRINTGWADGALVMPGGHSEAGETALQTAVRELQEELGLTLGQERFRLFSVGNVRTNYEYILHAFAVELRDNEAPVNNELDKCSELVWCDPAKLPKDVPKVFQVAVEQGYTDKQRYFEAGYDEPPTSD